MVNANSVTLAFLTFFGTAHSSTPRDLLITTCMGTNLKIVLNGIDVVEPVLKNRYVNVISRTIESIPKGMIDNEAMLSGKVT